MEDNIKSIKNSSLNKTWLLVTGLVILTVILLVVSLSAKNFPKAPTVSKDTKTDFAFTSLEISQDARASSVSGSYEVDINIDTDKNEITGVQLELTFDPSKLTKVNIVPGDFLLGPAVLIKDIDTKNGRITFALGNKPGEKAVKGSGTVAVLSFSKAAPEATNINFLPHTAVSAPGYNQSVLRETVSAVIGALSNSATGSSKKISPVITP